MKSAGTTFGSILVVGGGGHGKAVVGAALAAGYDVRAVYDDDETKWGRGVLGVPIFGPINRILEAPRMPVVLAIADAATRRNYVERMNLEWATLIHPTAFIDPSVEIGIGLVAFAGAIVQADVIIGVQAILNANATVGHDCVLGDYVHLAPGVDLGRGVHVGSGVFVGIGAVAVPYVRIGAGTTVGAGGAVMNDLPERVVAVGCPAKPIKKIAPRNSPTGVDP